MQPGEATVGNGAAADGRGRNPSVSQLLAICMLGAAGSFEFMLLPMLVGALTRSGAYSDSLAGIVGAMPMAGMFVGALVATALAPRWNTRSGGIKALAVLALMHVASAMLWKSPLALCVVQFGAGLAGVQAMSLAMSTLGRTATPDRNFGVFIAVQMTLGVAGTLLLDRLPGGTTVLGVLAMLAAAAVLALPVVAAIPEHLAMPASGPTAGAPWKLFSRAGNTPPGGAVAVLVTQLAFGVGIMLIWSFAARIAAGHGLGEHEVATALSVSLGASIVGALFAAMSAQWLRPAVALGGGTVGMVAAVVLMVVVPSAPVFMGAAAVFGFMWNYLPPYQLGIAARADRSGALVILSIAFVKLGYAGGSAAGGMLADSTGGFDASAALASLAFVLALAAALFAARGFPDPSRPS